MKFLLRSAEFRAKTASFTDAQNCCTFLSEPVGADLCLLMLAFNQQWQLKRPAANLKDQISLWEFAGPFLDKIKISNFLFLF